MPHESFEYIEKVHIIPKNDYTRKLIQTHHTNTFRVLEIHTNYIKVTLLDPTCEIPFIIYTNEADWVIV